jgi:hypothetical protein
LTGARRARRRSHNAHLHATGIVHSLIVHAAPRDSSFWGAWGHLPVQRVHARGGRPTEAAGAACRRRSRARRRSRRLGRADRARPRWSCLASSGWRRCARGGARSAGDQQTGSRCERRLCPTPILAPLRRVRWADSWFAVRRGRGLVARARPARHGRGQGWDHDDHPTPVRARRPSASPRLRLRCRRPPSATTGMRGVNAGAAAWSRAASGRSLMAIRRGTSARATAARAETAELRTPNRHAATE